MAIATNAQKESTAAGYVATATHATLHTADPGTTGASEVTGGSPAYAIKAITWTAGAVDGVYTSDPIDFDVPAGTTLTHAGVWNGSGRTDFRDKCAISATFSAQGVYRLTLTYTQS